MRRPLSVHSNLAIHHVCGVDELHEAPLLAAHRIVSILDSNDPSPLALRSIAVPVLTLRFDDVIASPYGAAPTKAQIERLLEFDAAARDDERLVVHCTAGISRSTAALAVLLSARHPGRDDEIFAAIRQIRPRAWPNSLVVLLGDQVLGRRGALVAALGRHYEFQVAHPELGPMFRMWARAGKMR